MSDTSLDRLSQKRLEAVLAEYLQQSETGQAPDRQQVLDRHPDLAGPLQAFFSNFDHLRGLSSPFAPAMDTPGLADGAAPAKAETMDEQRNPETAADKECPWPRRFGDFELLAEIARGGMGVVFRARETGVDRKVALKMIRDQELASAEEVQRFFLEAEAAAGLEHPHIVRIHRIGVQEGQHYFTMQLVEGGSLSQALAACQVEDQDCRRRRSFQRAIAEVLARVARAVHHAHQRGVLHRDLKPGNVLLEHANPPGTPALTNLQTAAPIVTDFGLAKKVDKHPGLTQPGAIIGTPAYIAPEQAQGNPPTTAADVYGLGAILYEVATGSPPFQGPTPLETLLLVMRSPLKRPRALNSGLDRELETICLKCLQKDPDKRYASAELLAEDLERWLAQKPIRARRAGPVHRAIKWARRHTVAAALLFLVALTPLTAYAYGAYREASFERERLAAQEAKQRQIRDYGENIRRGQEALDAEDKELARKYLDAAALPEVRGWEWHCLDHLCQAGPTKMQLRPTPAPIKPPPIKPPFFPPPARIHQANFSYDGRRVVGIYGQPARAVVWDALTGEVVEILRGGGTGGFDEVVLSHDGRLLALAIPDALRTVSVPVGMPFTLDPLGQMWSAGLPSSLVPYAPQRSRPLGVYRGPGMIIPGGASGPFVRGGLPGFGGIGGIGMRDPFGMHSDPLAQILGRPMYADPVAQILGRQGLLGPRTYGLGAYGGLGGFGSYDGLGGLGLGYSSYSVLGMRGIGIGYSPYAGLRYGSPNSTDAIMRALGSPMLDLHYGPTGLERLLPGNLPGFGPRYRVLPATVPQRQRVPGLLGVFDLFANREPLKVTEGMNRVAFSADGSLIGASTGEAVSVRKASTGEVTHTLGRHPGTVRALAFSGDGRILATGGDNGTVRLWEIASGRDLANFTVGASAQAPDQKAVTQLVFSPDGKRLMVKSQNDAVMVWDVSAAREAFVLPTGCRAAAFSPDSERLVLARADGTMAIAKALTGEEVCAVPRFKGEVRSLAFRPDGALAVAVVGDSDLTVQVWKGAP